jgi:tetratricopeptide (TPR) repeat protein
MTSSAPTTASKLLEGLRSLKVLFTVIVIGVVLGFVEHRQSRQHGHLSAYDTGGVPQLHGEALERFAQQAYELGPDDAQPNIMMGIALAEQGRGKQARVHLERALEIDRRDPQLLFFYAQVLHALGEDPATVRRIRNELKENFPQDWAFAQPEFERVDRERALSRKK